MPSIKVKFGVVEHYLGACTDSMITLPVKFSMTMFQFFHEYIIYTCRNVNELPLLICLLDQLPVV